MVDYDNKILNVASYIVSKTQSSSKIRTQKLCYIAYGFHLAKHNQELFKNDFEAWDYGPVVKYLYNAQNNNLTNYNDYSFTQEEQKTIDFVINHYKDFEDFRLVSMTHEVGTPWHKVYAKYENNKLEKKDIKISFENKIKDIEFFKKNENKINKLIYQLSKT